MTASARSEAVIPIIIGVVALIIAGVLIARQLGATEWPAFADGDLRAPVGIALGVALIMFAAGIYGVSQLRRLRRVEEALSSSHPDATPAAQPTNQGPVDGATVTPPLGHEVIRARKLPKPPVKLRRISSETNVIGKPPIKILHLWVFENPVRLANYVGSAWREFGHVHLLRSAASISRRELSEAERRGGIKNLYAATRDEVDSAIDGFVYLPDYKHLKTFKTEGARGGTWDRYGGYRVNALLCHGDVWQYALSSLLAMVDVVTMDLSGYTPANQGSHYELATLLDRIPTDRVVWLTDPWSDVSYLVEQMRHASQRLAPDSPNRSGQAEPMRLVVTDQVRRRTTKQGDMERTEEELAANRGEARRIATHLLPSAPRAAGSFNRAPDTQAVSAPPFSRFDRGGDERSIAAAPALTDPPRHRRRVAGVIALALTLVVLGSFGWRAIDDDPDHVSELQDIAAQSARLSIEAASINGVWDALESELVGHERDQLYMETHGRLVDLDGKTRELVSEAFAIEIPAGAGQAPAQLLSSLEGLNRHAAGMIAGLEQPQGVKALRLDSLAAYQEAAAAVGRWAETL